MTSANISSVFSAAKTHGSNKGKQYKCILPSLLIPSLAFLGVDFFYNPTVRKTQCQPINTRQPLNIQLHTAITLEVSRTEIWMILVVFWTARGWRNCGTRSWVPFLSCPLCHTPWFGRPIVRPEGGRDSYMLYCFAIVHSPIIDTLPWVFGSNDNNELHWQYTASEHPPP